MVKVRILVAESSDIALSGILTILNGSRSITIAGTAQSASDALKLFSRLKPDLCLISSTLKGLNVSEFMYLLFRADKHSKVVFIADNIDITNLNQALKAGVTGYLTKNIDKNSFRKALLSAAAGEKVFSEPVSSMMTDQYADLTQNKPRPRPIEEITKREAEVLQLIVDGFTSQEIAKILYISPRTVETHRSNLLHKLNIKNTAGLVKYALEKGPFSIT